MALSQRRTTVAILRGILGPVAGGEARFAKLAKRSRSWVKKVSAGLIPLSEETACRLELETGAPLEWLLSDATSAPLKPSGEPITREEFEWYRAQRRAGEYSLRRKATLAFAGEIVGIGSAAGQKGMMNLFLWRLNEFIDRSRQEFGFSQEKKRTVMDLIRAAPGLKDLYFGDSGVEFVDISGIFYQPGRATRARRGDERHETGGPGTSGYRSAREAGGPPKSAKHSQSR